MKTVKQNTEYGDLSGQIYNKNHPKYNGDFDISYYELDSLIGSPKEITEDTFNCSKNNLKNLVGSPKKVGYFYKCDDNPHLESLEGGPSECVIFSCEDCPKLEDVKGQVIKYGIKAKQYFCNGKNKDFMFEEIEEEFKKARQNTSVTSKGFRTLLGLDK